MKSPTTTTGLVAAALFPLVFLNLDAQGAQSTNPNIKACETQVPTTTHVPSEVYDPAEITQYEYDRNNPNPLKQHILMSPDRYSCNQLVVFLSGSEGIPQKHSWILKAAASARFRTIGLSYDTKDDTTKPNPSIVCYDLGLDASSGIDCQAEIRKDHILGGNRLADLADTYLPAGISLNYVDAGILQEDSVVGELVFLLERLAANDSWYDQFLSPNRVAQDPQAEDIIWENIILDGFSQGSGHGTLMATMWEVQGYVGFSGPFDSDLSNVSANGLEVDGIASWIHEGETPGSRRFHMHHLKEEGGAWTTTPVIPRNMNALNLPRTYALRPETLSWDELVALNAHRFGTDRVPQCNATAYHGSVAVDGCQYMITNRYGFELTDTFDLHVHMFQRAGE